MSNIEEMRGRLKELIQRDALKLGDFTLSAGQKSNYYLNLKNVTLTAEGLSLCGQILLDAIHQYNTEKSTEIGSVGGLTLGADPIVSAVSMQSFQTDHPLSAVIVRKEPKGHGTEQWLEGAENLSPETIIAVLEDVSTTGQAAATAVEKLKEAGYQVPCIFTIVDRESGARERFQEAGIEFSAIFSVSELVDKI